MKSTDTLLAPAVSTTQQLDFRKSFLKTRIVVGVIGVLLAPVVVFGDRLIFNGMWQPTLSDYYYSDLRNWFVGSLWAIGSGLLIYLSDRTSRPDSVISFAAGLLAIGVALFPTSHAPDVGESAVSDIHKVIACALLVLLSVISFRFGLRDGRRPDRTARWQRTWRVIHLACGGLIAAATAALIILGLAEVAGVGILVAEAVAVTVFGLSWFLKGSELFNLLREEHDKPPLLRARVTNPGEKR